MAQTAVAMRLIPLGAQSTRVADGDKLFDALFSDEELSDFGTDQDDVSEAAPPTHRLSCKRELGMWPLVMAASSDAAELPATHNLFGNPPTLRIGDDTTSSHLGLFGQPSDKSIVEPPRAVLGETSAPVEIGTAATTSAESDSEEVQTIGDLFGGLRPPGWWCGSQKDERTNTDSTDIAAHAQAGAVIDAETLKNAPVAQGETEPPSRENRQNEPEPRITFFANDTESWESVHGREWVREVYLDGRTTHFNGGFFTKLEKLVWLDKDTKVRDVPAPVLGFLVKKLENYEPGVVQIVRNYVRPVHQKTLENRAFPQSVRHITLPNGLVNIQAGQFAHLRALKTLETPLTLETIGESAMSGCLTLTRVSLHSGLQEIQSNAFIACDRLPEISIPDGVLTVGSDAFFLCCDLRKANLPPSLAIIERRVFGSCRRLTELQLPSGLLQIKERAFAGCQTLPTVDVPAGTTIISDQAFMMCSALSSVSFPPTLLHIGFEAFHSCKLLTQLRLPGSITFLGHGAFSGCTSLARVVIDDTHAKFELGKRVFWGCSSLVAVRLPRGLASIGESAFRKCTSLEEINFPETLIHIGARGFETTNLKTVELPRSVQNVGSQAFRNCRNLKKVTFPNSTRISTHVFAFCSRLQEVVLPVNLTTIPSKLFESCAALDRIGLPTSLECIDSHAFSRSGLTKLELPTSLVSIRDSAFANCGGLTEVTLPKGLEHVACAAFGNNDALRAVSLSRTTQNIHKYAFAGCRHIRDLTVRDAALNDINIDIDVPLTCVTTLVPLESS